MALHKVDRQIAFVIVVVEDELYVLDLYESSLHYMFEGVRFEYGKGWIPVVFAEDLEGEMQGELLEVTLCD